MSLRRAAVCAAVVATAACSRSPLPTETCGTRYCLRVDELLSTPPPGATQSLEIRDGSVFTVVDAKTGLIQPWRVTDEGLERDGEPIPLTIRGEDEIPHPTGLTFHEDHGTFLGRAGGPGTGHFYRLDWPRLLETRVLEGALLHRIQDGASFSGSRPEFVEHDGRSLVASADYGAEGNEVRLYDPALLATALNTTAAGVVVARFATTPFVQSLHWWEAEQTLVLAQNTRRYDGWRITLVDLPASVASGTLVALDVLEPGLTGELEGIHFLEGSRILIVTNAKLRNTYFGSLRRVPAVP